MSYYATTRPGIPQAQYEGDAATRSLQLFPRTPGLRVQPSVSAPRTWYHLRTVHILKTLLPEAVPFFAIGYDPIYAGEPVTRASWPGMPDGRRRVVREADEAARRIVDGSLHEAIRAEGAWR